VFVGVKGHLVDRGTAGTPRWYAVLEDHDPSTGRRKRRWVNLKTALKREAQDALAKLLTQKQEGMLPSPGKVTVAAVLRGFLDSRRTAGKAPSTLYRYGKLVELHIIPALGHIRLTDVRPAHLQEHYARELVAPRGDGKPGTLAPRTVQFQHQILHAALKQAVLQGLIHRNPADAVTPPRPLRKEQSVLSPEQAAVLLESLAGHRLYGLFFLALSTGMRLGELSGLRWSDVDLDAARFSVRVQRQYLPGEGIQERETKEHRGERPIEMTHGEVEVLRRHQALQAEERLRLGPIWQEHGLVFPSEAGTPLYPRNVQRFLKAQLQKVGLPPVRFHDLRHTAGTLIMREDGRVVVAQHRLGHAKASTTMDMYGHALPGDQREAAEKVLAAIQRARPTRKPGKTGSGTKG
jgi:integrase